MNESNPRHPHAAHRRCFLQSIAAGFAVTALPSRSAAENSDGDALLRSGAAPESLASIDRMMTGFVTLYDVPGAALAVTRNGRLVYARGFGFADLEKKTPVQPDTLFRIASVSKPLTAAAVLQLVENGKLSLTDHAFHLLDIKPHLEPGSKIDPRVWDITVQQLLHHTAGWDSAVSPDPMGQVAQIGKALAVDPPAMPEQIIRYVMGRPLDFAPGTRSAYSNFGYCVLGRIVEKSSGQTYEQYVRKQILAPLGITAMRIGKTLRDGRAPNEACYYDTFQRTAPAVMGKEIGGLVPLPYGTSCLEAMDSHGGWIASVRDLVRFASSLDNPDTCKFLTTKSVATMFDRPPGAAGYEPTGAPKAAYYACGWNVRPVGDAGKFNAWHNGILSGSAALLVRRFDGIDWAVLFNAAEAPHGAFLGDLIDFYCHYAIDKIKDWPDIDLFLE